MSRACRVLVVAALLVGACSSTSDASRESSTTSTALSGSGDGAALLLGTEAVAELPGLADAIAQEISDVATLENPDPRGPCGTPVPSLPLDDAIARSFVGAGGVLIQVVVPAGAEAEQHMRAMVADVVEPCGPYESTTDLGTGTTQRVENIEAEVFGDADGVVTTGSIDGEPYAAALVQVSPAHLVFVVAFSTEPIDFLRFEAFIDSIG